jgi:putative membrane protein
MRKVHWLLALVPLMFGGIARAEMNKLTSIDDRKFIEEAASGGMAEIKLGKLAIDRAQSPEVKEFARRMVDDHARVGNELKSLAMRKNMTLPSAIDTKHMADYQKLASLSPADFDRAYMDMMVRDHDADVNAFRKIADQGGDPDLKSWAMKTLPTLEEHQQMAHRIADQLRRR